MNIYESIRVKSKWFWWTSTHAELEPSSLLRAKRAIQGPEQTRPNFYPGLSCFVFCPLLTPTVYIWAIAIGREYYVLINKCGVIISLELVLLSIFVSTFLLSVHARQIFIYCRLFLGGNSSCLKPAARTWGSFSLRLNEEGTVHCYSRTTHSACVLSCIIHTRKVEFSMWST